MTYRPYCKSFWYKICLFVSTLVISGAVYGQPIPRITTSSKPYKPSKSSAARLGALLDGLQTINNNQIEVGIDTRYGGAITHLKFLNDRSGNVSTENMVNNPDLGRQIQVGLYSGPLDYSKNGAAAWTGLGWNPIQAGDTYRNPSEVVTVEKQENLLYVKTIPKQFALNNEPGEATIEQWIRLENNVVKVHARVVLFRSDKTQYNARQQEMPCAYLNADYHNMWYYKGNSPFTNGALELSRQQPPQTFLFGDVYPTETWMASTNDNGYGVGLYVQNNYDWKRGYFGSDLSGNEFSDAASYIAATNYVVLDPNIVHEWDYELIVGHLNEIRAYVYAQPRPLAGPNYHFDTSRKGWYYYGTQDTGWPIQGKLHVLIDESKDNDIKSPFAFWKGRDNPKLYIRAAFNTQHPMFRLGWRRVGDETFDRNPDRYMDFSIINDGQFHTYEIDLSGNENWLNYNIGQIEFSSIPGGIANNSWVEMEWISTSATGPGSEVVVNPPITQTPTVVDSTVVTTPVVIKPVEVTTPVVIKPAESDPTAGVVPPATVPCVSSCLPITIVRIR